MRRLLVFLCCLAITVVMAGKANALIIDTIGTQDFADGTTPLLASTFTAAGAGEPSPFDGTIFGSDPGGTLGSFSYTHNFSLGGLTPLVASLTIGLFDHDSFTASQDTIDIYFDGVKQNDSAFLGISTAPSSYSVVSLGVDPTLLLDQSLTVSIYATQAAQGFPGNSIGGDFSKLEIETGAVPEPATLLLLGSGIAGIGLVRRRFKG